MRNQRVGHPGLEPGDDLTAVGGFGEGLPFVLCIRLWRPLAATGGAPTRVGLRSTRHYRKGQRHLVITADIANAGRVAIDGGLRKEVAHLLGSLSADVRPLFAYIANTGLRVGTALSTQPEWIDWEGASVRYPARAMKSRRPHVVELNRAAEQALRVAVAASPNDPFPILYWTAYRRWCEGREAAGYPTLRIHDLRHSFVSNQLSAGTPIHVVRDLAGHASIVTTQLYAHSSDEARREAMNRVQVPAALGPIPDPPKPPRDTNRDTKEDPANAQVREIMVGHPGLEPGANGLRIHCSTIELMTLVWAPSLRLDGRGAWHTRKDSNLRPTDSKSGALSS